MIPSILFFLLVALAGYVGMIVYLLLGQSRYVYYPSRRVLATPADAGLRFERLRIRTIDGQTLAAWFVPAPETAGGTNAITVLHCHGNAGNVGTRIGLARAFYDLGFNTLLFDYRGYGESTGKPDEEGTYRDVEMVWHYLTRVRRIPPSRLVVHGQSLGGPIAAWLARKVQPGALVLESTFTSASAMATRMFPLVPARRLCRFRYNTLSYLREVTCPVLIAHSLADEMIPYQHGRRLFEAVRDPKTFVELTGDHNAGGLETDAAYRRAFVDFIRRHMTTGKASPADNPLR